MVMSIRVLCCRDRDVGCDAGVISVFDDGVKGSYGGTIREAEDNVARIDNDI